jgi:hypothetical protein
MVGWELVGLFPWDSTPPSYSWSVSGYSARVRGRFDVMEGIVVEDRVGWWERV